MTKNPQRDLTRKVRPSVARVLRSVESLESRRLPASILTFGAVGNGVHDDGPALQAALDALGNQGGGTLTLPAGTYKIVRTAATPSLAIPADVTIAGAGQGVTELDLVSDVPTPDYRALFSVTGNNTTLSNLTMVRESAIDGVMVTLGTVANFTMNDVTINGNDAALGTGFHGIEVLPTGQPVSNLRFSGDTITGVDYGFFIPNSSTGSLSSIDVSDCVFHDNYADDLEFNAPNATATGVSVVNNTFANNHSSADWAGFGVGLAHVTGATISGNTFRNYRYEPIHIEDDSADVAVSRNSITAAYTSQTDWSSAVFIITGSHDITIDGNTIDLSSNTDQVSAVYAGPGGVNATYPYDIAVTGNTVKLNASGSLATNYTLSGYVQSDNLVEAPPVGLTAAAAGPGQVDLTWGAGSAEDAGYLVFRRPSSGGSWRQVASLAAGVLGYGDAGLPVGSYEYRVVATYAGGVTSVPATGVQADVITSDQSANTVTASSTGSSLTSDWTTYGGSWSESGGAVHQTSTDYGDNKKLLLTGEPAAANEQITALVRVDSWVDGDFARAGVGLYADPSSGLGYNLVFHGGTGAPVVQFLNDESPGGWGNAYPFDWTVGTAYWFKLEDLAGVLYGKVWAAGNVEPAGWMFEQSGWTMRAPGQAALVGGGTGPGSSTASFADVSVETPGSAAGLASFIDAGAKPADWATVIGAGAISGGVTAAAVAAPNATPAVADPSFDVTAFRTRAGLFTDFAAGRSGQRPSLPSWSFGSIQG